MDMLARRGVQLPSLIVQDAATPIAAALQAVYDGPQGGHRIRSVTCAYGDSCVTVTVSPELDQKLRRELFDRFIDAFQVHGWGFSTLLQPQTWHPVSVSFTHPLFLTRSR